MVVVCTNLLVAAYIVVVLGTNLLVAALTSSYRAAHGWLAATGQAGQHAHPAKSNGAGEAGLTWEELCGAIGGL